MKRLLLLVLVFLPWLAAWPQDVLPVPELTARVIDQTGTLQPQQRQALEDKLATFEQDTGTQMAILMVPTTQPEDIFSYANRVANAWKIGRRDVGDGVLVVVAKDDRRVRIEVAKTLEGAIPDLAAGQVIDTAITPAFRRGDFAGGLDAATDQLMARIRGEALPAPARPGLTRADAGFDWFDLVIFLFFAVPIVGGVLRAMLGGKLGAFVMGGGVGLLALLVTSSIVVAVLAGLFALVMSLLSGGLGMGAPRRRTYGHGGPWIGPGWGGGGWGGGRGGWGGGGGFGSGGGGNFGGGGASGSW